MQGFLCLMVGVNLGEPLRSCHHKIPVENRYRLPLRFHPYVAVPLKHLPAHMTCQSQQRRARSLVNQIVIPDSLWYIQKTVIEWFGDFSTTGSGSRCRSGRPGP